MSYIKDIVREGEKYAWGYLLVDTNDLDNFIERMIKKFRYVKVLEIGAWKRMLGRHLVDRFGDKLEYVGVDVLDPGGDKSLEFHIMAPTYLLFKPKTFHVVVMVEILEHIFDYVQALREVHRVLVDGGGVYIQSVICTSPSAIDDKTHVHVLHPVTLTRLLEHIGFIDVEYSTKGASFILKAFKG